MVICIIISLLILYKLDQKENLTPIKKADNIQKTLNYDNLSNNFNNTSLNDVKQEDVNLSFLGQKYDLNESKNDLNLSIKELNTTKDLNISDENESTNIILEQNITKNDEVKKQIKEQNLSSKKIKNKTTNSKAKLAIIIDDMANKNQVSGLKKLNLKLNPSFFPPDKTHPYTPKFSQEFEFFMVHLPLAAINYNKPELDTLHPSDDKIRICNKIKQIKKDFKNIRYINNHTGSLFTKDENAMYNLYSAFKKYNIDFVDSKTIGSTKAPVVSKQLNKKYIKRDIFLDNEDDVNYIKNQISKAVALAKKNGTAIAIGHPRTNTFKALKESKDLLNTIELVYISELYGD